MFLKLQPLLYSLIFLIGLEAIVLEHKYVLIVVFFLFIISLYQGKIVGGKWKFSVLPVFFTLSSVALLYLITLNYEQQTFILLTSLMYYLSLFGAYRLNRYSGDQTARGMNMAATISTIFFTYAGAYGLYLNFLVPLWWLMIIYLVVTALVSYQYFSIIYFSNNSIKNVNHKPADVKDKIKQRKMVLIYSFLIALAMVEVVWTISFWPFGYLTSGIIALILYYVLWDLIQSHFLNLLSKRRMIANLIFFSFAIALILISSRWMPVV